MCVVSLTIWVPVWVRALRKCSRWMSEVWAQHGEQRWWHARGKRLQQKKHQSRRPRGTCNQHSFKEPKHWSHLRIARSNLGHTLKTKPTSKETKCTHCIWEVSLSTACLERKHKFGRGVALCASIKAVFGVGSRPFLRPFEGSLSFLKCFAKRKW